MKYFLLGALFVVMGFYLGVRLTENQFPYEVLPIKNKFGEIKQADNPMLEPIVKIADEKGRAFCTAFVVDPGYAITAAHCLFNKGKLYKGVIRVFDQTGKDVGIKAEAAGMATRSDLGLVRGDFSHFKLLKADLTHFGFIRAVPYFLTCGYPYGQKELICNPFIPETNYGFSVVGRGFLVPGMSGGPVIDPTTNEAIGLNSYGAEGIVGVYPLQGFLGAFGLD